MRTHASKRRSLRTALALATLCAALAAIGREARPTCAQSGGGYDLSWSTIDGGGATHRAGGDYILGGTAGQPDAGVMTGGPYTLAGGFWGGDAVAAPQNSTYLPLVLDSP